MFVLEEVFKSKKHELPESVNLRLSRGLSWLKQALDLDHSPDLQFISLWVALNALYIKDTDLAVDEQHVQEFIDDLYRQDRDHKIEKMLWGKHQSLIEQWLGYHNTHPMYWDWQHAKLSYTEYKVYWEVYLTELTKTYTERNGLVLLKLIFERLYCYRNQLLFGGMRSQSLVYQQQLQDACQLLKLILLKFLYIVLESEPQHGNSHPYFPMMHLS